MLHHKPQTFYYAKKSLHKYFSSKNFIARRAIADIGSGSIKFQISDIDTKNNKIINTLMKKNQQILFMGNLLDNNNNISENLQQDCLSTLKQLIQESNFIGVDDFQAIATEAFRKANNGKQCIDFFQNNLKIPIRILNSHQEAKYGFQNAYAHSHVKQNELISVDCGSGSFQMSSEADTHFDCHGSGTILKQAQIIKAEKELYPFSRQDIEFLLNFLHKNLKDIPIWIKDKSKQFVAVGSTHSIFNQYRVLTGLNQFQQTNVEQLLNILLNMDRQEIYLYEKECQEKNNIQYNVTIENSNYIIPKLALLLGIMRKSEIEKLLYHETNGNCSALLTDLNLWQNNEVKNQQKIDNDQQNKLITVNWHIQKDCNYKCKFCFAHFDSVKKQLDKEQGFEMIKILKENDIYKINFAGGEPFMNQYLGDYIQYAKEIGLKTSIITNASRMTYQWLIKYGKFIDQIGVSCDSLHDSVQKDLGRGFGNHVDITIRAFQRIKKINQEQNLNIQIKLNTVVLRQNFNEDWNDFILKYGIKRWKIFKILLVKGENDNIYDQLSISDEQFKQFIDRHEGLRQKNVVIASEDNDQMNNSYIMITPDGKFYQNTDSNYYQYSDEILKIGFERAIKQTNFQYGKFINRGGNYQL